MLSVRIVNADYYMSVPISGLDVTYSEFRASEIEKVPVIRIFGTTQQGIKTCVHVHGVFPYICVPYDSVEPHTKVAYQIAVSLDKAINISLNNANSQAKHVHKVVLVSGTPFYGYHAKEHQFLKIYFYQPGIMKKAVSLLENGAVLNRVFQPHEAHVSFMLQFFIDFNLYGMSYVHFAHGRYRRTGSSAMDSIPQELLLPDTVKASSVSPLEADVVSSDIINATSKPAGSGVVNPGLAAIWDDEKQRRLDDGVTETPRLHSQRRALPPTESDTYYREKITAKLESLLELRDSLSGESSSGSRISYPCETPVGANVLEASFVSVHGGRRDRPDEKTSPESDLDESVVDEEVVRNLNASQMSQRHNYSQLDEDDLELLMVMENLAHYKTQTVDANSVLGSQLSEPGEGPAMVEPEAEEDEENWLDRTLVSNEVEEENRPTTPLLEEEELSQNSNNEDLPWEDSFWNGVNSSYLLNEDKIPQLDGALDEDLPAQGCRRRFGMRGRIPSGSRNRASRMTAPPTHEVEPPEEERDDPSEDPSEDPSTVPQETEVTPAPTNSENILDTVNLQAGSAINCAECLLFGENGCGAPPCDHFETPQVNGNLPRFAGAFNVPLDQGGLNLEDFCSSGNSFIGGIANPDGVLHSQMLYLPNLPSDIYRFVSEREAQVAGVFVTGIPEPVGNVSVAPEGNSVAEAIPDVSSSSSSSSYCDTCQPLVNEETGLALDSSNLHDVSSVLIGNPSLYQNFTPGRKLSSGNNDSASFDADNWFEKLNKNQSMMEAIARECVPSQTAQGVSSKPIAWARRSSRILNRTSSSSLSLKSSQTREESLVDPNIPAASSTPVCPPAPPGPREDTEPGLSAQQDYQQPCLDVAASLSPCSCLDGSVNNEGWFEGLSQNVTCPRNVYTKQSEKEYERLRENKMEEILAGSSNEISPSKEARTRELQAAVEEQQGRRCRGTCSRARTQRGTLPSSLVPPFLWAMEDDVGDSDDSEETEDPRNTPRTKKKNVDVAIAAARKVVESLAALRKVVKKLKHRNDRTILWSAFAKAASMQGASETQSSGEDVSQQLQCSVSLSRLEDTLAELSQNYVFDPDSILNALSSPVKPIHANVEGAIQKNVAKKNKRGRQAKLSTVTSVENAAPSSSGELIATSGMPPQTGIKKRVRPKPSSDVHKTVVPTVVLERNIIQEKARSIFSPLSSPCPPVDVPGTLTEFLVEKPKDGDSHDNLTVSQDLTVASQDLTVASQDLTVASQDVTVASQDLTDASQDLTVSSQTGDTSTPTLASKTARRKSSTIMNVRRSGRRSGHSDLVVETPSTPDEAPPTPVEGPSTAVDFPPTPVKEPPTPTDLPQTPVEVPATSMEGPPTEMEVPPIEMDVPPTAVEVPRTPVEVPPTPFEVPPTREVLSKRGFTPKQKERFSRLSLSSRTFRTEGKRSLSVECLSVRPEKVMKRSLSVDCQSSDRPTDNFRPGPLVHAKPCEALNNMNVASAASMESTNHTPQVTPSKAKTDVPTKRSGRKSSSKKSFRVTPLGKDLESLRMTPFADRFSESQFMMFDQQKQKGDNFLQRCEAGQWPGQESVKEENAPSTLKAGPSGSKSKVNRRNPATRALFVAPRRRGRPRRSVISSTEEELPVNESLPTVSEEPEASKSSTVKPASSSTSDVVENPTISRTQAVVESPAVQQTPAVVVNPASPPKLVISVQRLQETVTVEKTESQVLPKKCGTRIVASEDTKAASAPPEVSPAGPSIVSVPVVTRKDTADVDVGFDVGINTARVSVSGKITPQTSSRSGRGKRAGPTQSAALPSKVLNSARKNKTKELFGTDSSNSSTTDSDECKLNGLTPEKTKPFQNGIVSGVDKAASNCDVAEQPAVEPNVLPKVLIPCVEKLVPSERLMLSPPIVATSTHTPEKSSTALAASKRRSTPSRKFLEAIADGNPVSAKSSRSRGSSSSAKKRTGEKLKVAFTFKRSESSKEKLSDTSRNPKPDPEAASENHIPDSTQTDAKRAKLPARSPAKKRTGEKLKVAFPFKRSRSSKEKLCDTSGSPKRSDPEAASEDSIIDSTRTNAEPAKPLDVRAASKERTLDSNQLGADLSKQSGEKVASGKPTSDLKLLKAQRAKTSDKEVASGNSVSDQKQPGAKPVKTSGKEADFEACSSDPKQARAKPAKTSGNDVASGVHSSDPKQARAKPAKTSGKEAASGGHSSDPKQARAKPAKTLGKEVTASGAHASDPKQPEAKPAKTSGKGAASEACSSDPKQARAKPAKTLSKEAASEACSSDPKQPGKKPAKMLGKEVVASGTRASDPKQPEAGHVNTSDKEVAASGAHALDRKQAGAKPAKTTGKEITFEEYLSDPKQARKKPAKTSGKKVVASGAHASDPKQPEAEHVQTAGKEAASEEYLSDPKQAKAKPAKTTGKETTFEEYLSDPKLARKKPAKTSGKKVVASEAHASDPKQPEAEPVKTAGKEVVASEAHASDPKEPGAEPVKTAGKEVVASGAHASDPKEAEAEPVKTAGKEVVASEAHASDPKEPGAEPVKTAGKEVVASGAHASDPKQPEKTAADEKPLSKIEASQSRPAKGHCLCRCQSCWKRKNLDKKRARESSSSSSDDSDSSDSDSTSSSLDSSSVSSSSEKHFQEKVPLDERGHPMVVIKMGVGPASKSRKYIKANSDINSKQPVEDPKQVKTTDETVSSTMSPEAVVETPNLSRDLSTEIVAAPEASPAVSSTTPKCPPSLILSPNSTNVVNVRAAGRKRKLENPESDGNPPKRIRTDEGRKAVSPDSNVSTTMPPENGLKSSAANYLSAGKNDVKSLASADMKPSSKEKNRSEASSKEFQSSVQKAQPTSRKDQSTSQKVQSTHQKAQSSHQKTQSSPRKAKSSSAKAQSSPRKAKSSSEKAKSSPRKAKSSSEKAQYSPRKAQSSSEKALSSPRKAQSSSEKAQSSSRKAQSSPRKAKSSPRKDQISRQKEGPSKKKGRLTQAFLKSSLDDLALKISRASPTEQ